jgi:hypothetical protein
MGMSFTQLHIFKTSTRNLELTPDEQVVEFIKLLDGKISSWQVVSPSSNQRILYYEMEDGRQAKQVEGSQLDLRTEMLGEIRKTRKVKEK